METATPEILVACSHGSDAAERATVPFIIASTAAAAGQRTVVVCTVDGVWIGTRDYADGLSMEGMPPLRELVDDLVAAGGGDLALLGMHACARHRGDRHDRRGTHRRRRPDRRGNGLRRIVDHPDLMPTPPGDTGDTAT